MMRWRWEICFKFSTSPSWYGFGNKPHFGVLSSSTESRMFYNILCKARLSKSLCVTVTAICHTYIRGSFRMSYGLLNTSIFDLFIARQFRQSARMFSYLLETSIFEFLAVRWFREAATLENLLRPSRNLEYSQRNQLHVRIPHHTHQNKLFHYQCREKWAYTDKQNNVASPFFIVHILLNSTGWLQALNIP